MRGGVITGFYSTISVHIKPRYASVAPFALLDKLLMDRRSSDLIPFTAWSQYAINYCTFCLCHLCVHVTRSADEVYTRVFFT